ncbi:MAG: arginine--tRNA ligase [Candidatus Poribacteria bacterium]|nr:arginine--tRNA ligase [Candidatus Poribacteria bacterium]
MMSIANIKTEILSAMEAACKTVFGQRPQNLNLNYPPKVEFGDFAVGCFPLAKQFRQNPANIAQSIAAEIQPNESIQNVTAVGPYVNFKLHSSLLFGDVCTEIRKKKAFDNNNLGNGRRVMVEYLSPNTNKPLHLGHIRNGVLGMGVSNLLEAAGHTVIKANLVNDRGVHICKSMLAWSKWANGDTPESTDTKGDHFVGEWYVRYNQEAKKSPQLQEEVQAMLRKWESGDPATIKLWEMMNQWVYSGYEETYRRLGFAFDVFYYESNTYTLGKDLVQIGLHKGVFNEAASGAVIAPLPTDEFGAEKDGSQKVVTLLRNDGTSVYITQDLGTAKLKFDDHQPDRSIYVVATEQNYHFQCLFKLLNMLDFEWADGCYHLSYGMVNLPEGKMKSREGTVVDADDLIEEMRQLAEDEIRRRDTENTLSHEEIQKRALAIGLAAIKFYLLRTRPELDINFDPKESISFDGFTGPYCQYAYARCASILRKSKNRGLASIEPDYSLLGNTEELELLRVLIQFPDVVAEAAGEFTLARICNHVFAIAQAVNQFYHRHPVLAAEPATLVAARLALVSASAVVIRNSLALLGIEALEEM